MTAVTSAITRLRSIWSDRFIDRCTIVASTGAGTLNPTSLQYESAPAADSVYVGECLFRPETEPASSSFDGQGQAVQTTVVLLPYDAPAIPRDAIVTCTASKFNPHLVGLSLRVETDREDSYATRRRIVGTFLQGGGVGI